MILTLVLQSIQKRLFKYENGDFPGDPVAKTAHPRQQAWEKRFHMLQLKIPHDATKT